MAEWLTAPELREKQIAGPCLDLLKLRGWYPVRVLCGKFWTMDKQRVVSGPPKGTPDYLCIHPLHAGFFLEVKRPGGGLSADQRYQIQSIEKGYRLRCAVIDDPRKLSQWLDQHERKVMDSTGE